MKKILTKTFLIKEYVKNNKSPYRIAGEFGYSPNTIRRYLIKFNIKIRNKSEAQKADLNHKYIDGRTNKIYYCKEPGCNNIIDISTALYAGGRCKDCGNKNMARKAIGRERPDVSDNNKKRIGKNNPRYNEERHNKHHCKKCNSKICYTTWHIGSGLCGSCSAGGTGVPGENTEYGAEFDNALKEQVRFRDHYKCRECGCSQLENGKQLDCHHIDYNKKHNILNNLIALCMKCHRKTNFNRDYWEEYFQAKIKETV